MILRIEKPEFCMDCVFGEERGFCCSLLDCEQCYELHSDYDRPAWCPFDNDGKTITADGVYVVQEGAESKHGLL